MHCKGNKFLITVKILLFSSPHDKFPPIQNYVKRNNCEKGKFIFSSLDDLADLKFADSKHWLFIYLFSSPYIPGLNKIKRIHSRIPINDISQWRETWTNVGQNFRANLAEGIDYFELGNLPLSKDIRFSECIHQIS